MGNSHIRYIKIFMKIKLSYNKRLVIFSLVLFIIKILIIPYVHEIDADGVSRVYLSLQFANNPQIINTGNWPPIYFYIMGSALKIYSNQHVTPIIVNILFSILLIFPLFNLLKRQFEEKISFLLCVFFSFSPIVFRMSMLAMSEIPYLFFVISSISALAKGLSERKIAWILSAGILMSIAGGIRYESWILGVLVILIIAFFKTKKEALFFTLTFILIPTYWIFSSYIFTQEALHSFNWAINLPAENSIQSIDTLMRRIWWYPLSLMFAFGPIAFYFFIKELKYYNLNKISYTLFISFITFFIIWLINSLRGSLLLQHRFVLTLFLLSFPFVGFYFKRNGKNLVKKTVLFSLSGFLLAFVYSSKGARPIPRLLTKEATKVSSLINANIHSNSGFICDFWNWETTYYLPFATGLKEDNIAILESNEQFEFSKEKIETITRKYHDGVLLVNKNNFVQKTLIKQEKNYSCIINKTKLILKQIYEDETILCFKYKRIDLTQNS